MARLEELIAGFDRAVASVLETVAASAHAMTQTARRMVDFADAANERARSAADAASAKAAAAAQARWGMGRSGVDIQV